MVHRLWGIAHCASLLTRKAFPPLPVPHSVPRAPQEGLDEPGRQCALVQHTKEPTRHLLSSLDSFPHSDFHSNFCVSAPSRASLSLLGTPTRLSPSTLTHGQCASACIQRSTASADMMERNRYCGGKRIGELSDGDTLGNNPTFRIKICGITTPEHGAAAAQARADAVGLNFYPKSPRYITRHQAAEIIAAKSAWFGNLRIDSTRY